jgi:hypothetical protein
MKMCESCAISVPLNKKLSRLGIVREYVSGDLVKKGGVLRDTSTLIG